MLSGSPSSVDMADDALTTIAFIVVTSMMPRPILQENFNVTYRKIPVLAIGREVCPVLQSTKASL